MSTQTSLFPSRESLEAVEQEAIAMLPITEINKLLALVRLVENTVLGLKPTKDET